MNSYAMKLMLPAGLFKELQQAAKEAGVSVKGYVVHTLAEAMKQK